jgi:signal transduction histidine kinase
LGNIKLNESVRDLVEAIAATDKVILYLDDTAIENLEVDQAVHLSLYRILQEQLTNVLKHSGAVTVDISFELTGQHLLMKIVDDGKGFDLGIRGPGIGISNIKTRVESLEGKAFIQSAPGMGTSLTVQLPCNGITCFHPKAH